MNWLVELFVVVALFGFIFAVFSAAPQGPLAAASNRQTAETIYTSVLKMLYDPAFLDQLDRAICGDRGARGTVEAMLRNALGGLAYNFTVYPAGRLPACLVCSPPGNILYNSTLPYDPGLKRGYSGPFSWTLRTRAMLPDGAEVEVFIGVGRP